jgi:hypothetical protein
MRVARAGSAVRLTFNLQTGLEAWSLYYTPKHMKTLVRRAATTGVPMLNLAKYLLTFSTTDRLERVHPLQGGVLRLKHPSERRPNMPRESGWIFWPCLAWDTVKKHAILTRCSRAPDVVEDVDRPRP